MSLCLFCRLKWCKETRNCKYWFSCILHLGQMELKLAMTNISLRGPWHLITCYVIVWRETKQNKLKWYRSVPLTLTFCRCVYRNVLDVEHSFFFKLLLSMLCEFPQLLVLWSDLFLPSCLKQLHCPVNWWEIWDNTQKPPVWPGTFTKTGETVITANVQLTIISWRWC